MNKEDLKDAYFAITIKPRTQEDNMLPVPEFNTPV